jgi:BirA family biotin operon repressor/biotin-[acetyl-CoA-carboxylase] ligase
VPELPAAYDLVYYDQIDSLRDKACNLARRGAEEGTLLWAATQAKPLGRLDQKWHSSQGDLHCSIILRPDFSRHLYPQIMLVAAVSMANALATHLSAMTPLAFGWPNNITIASHKVAAIWLDTVIEPNSDKSAHQDGNHLEEDQPWLAVTASVNLEQSPGELSATAISVQEVEGTTELDSTVLLESYARQFITQINHWSERGIKFTGKQWISRAEGVGEQITIRLTDREITGTLEDFGENGDITITLPDNTRRTVSLAEYIEYR